MVYSALLTASMLADDGTYAMQVRGTLGDYVRHSNFFYATVFRSINAVDFFPPPLPSEFEQMEDRLTSINDNPPMPGENGYWMIWNPDKKEYEESDVPLPAGGSGSGNVSSPEISVIRVMDRQEYEELPTKSPTTLYLIRG